MNTKHKVLASMSLSVLLTGCNLTVSVNNGGQVISDPDGINCRADGENCASDFPNSANVLLTATADEGYIFSSWSGDIGNFCQENTCQLPMGKNRNVTATFDEISIIDGIPESVTWGETIYFKPFGDAPSNTYDVSIDLGPLGMEPLNQGLVAWTPGHPLLSQNGSVNLTFSRTTEAGSESISQTVTVEGTSANLPTTVGGFLVPTKEDHMVIADLDDDGKTEILVAGAGTLLYSMEHDGETYVKDWVLSEIPGRLTEINAINAGDFDGDSHWEILIAYRNELILLDGKTRAELARRTFSSESINQIIVSDIDKNGVQEILVAHGDRFFDSSFVDQISTDTLETQWQSESGEYDRVVVGQIDQDPQLELIFSTGRVLDGVTYQEEWQYPEAFGRRLTTADTNGDGIDEIVASQGWQDPVVYSGTLQSPIAELPVEHSGICTLGSEPVSGGDTILVGDCQHGEISAWTLNNNSPELIWEIDSVEHGSVGVRAGDTDNDGNNEYVWSTGISSSGPDDLVIASQNPLISVEWQARAEGALERVLYAPNRASDTGEGKRAIFASTSHNGFRSSKSILSVDLANGSYSVNNFLEDQSGEFSGIATADYDNNGIDELFLSGGLANRYYNETFGMYSLPGLDPLWQSPLGDDDDWASPNMLDINEDGYLDLVGTGDSKIQIFDIRNNSQLWSSVAINSLNGLATSTLSNGELALFGSSRSILWHYGPADDLFVVKNSYTTDDIKAVFTYKSGNSTRIALIVKTSFFSESSTIVLLDESLTPISETSIEGDVIDIYQPGITNDNVWVQTSRNAGHDGKVSTKVTAYDSLISNVVWESHKLPGYSRPGTKLFFDEDTSKVVFATSAAAYISQ